MKIFLGTEDMASVLSGLNEGFRALGHATTTYVSERNIYYDMRYDIEKGSFLSNIIDYRRKRIPEFLRYLGARIDARLTPHWLRLQSDKLINDHDLFIFIWKPWLPEWEIFEKIKKAGKKIICIQLGSDVRDASAFHQEYKVDVSAWDTKYHDSLDNKVKKIRHQELFADLIYSVPDQAGLSIRPFKHIYLPLCAGKEIEYKVPARDIPVILHAPTNPSIKGTDHIVRAIEVLKKEGYKFEFRLLRGLPNQAIIKELTNADILVDELLLHGPGVLGTEGMAAGCAVAVRWLSEYKNIFNPPVCNITEDSVLDQLRHLLDNRNYRLSLAESGRSFVEQYNNPVVIASNMLNDLDNFIPDYYPTFFLNEFELQNDRTLSRENRLLGKQIVKTLKNVTINHVRRAVAAGLIEPLDSEELRLFEETPIL